mmetsp:Transcript_31886/g.66544  ORF Transcript_31886/g.66544 Transcript_31886/m.66544 type:complete len:320 (-) Transcript_31886:1522-2481(-)
MLSSRLAVAIALSLLTQCIQHAHGFAEIRVGPSSPTTLFATDTDTTSSNIASSLEVQVVDQMPEPLPLELKNHYYLLRHGQSTANVASIISSDRGLAYTDKHGLTATGYEQGKQSAQQLLQALQETVQGPGEKVYFVSSPFARARGTAAACLDGLAELQDEIESGLKLDIESDVTLHDGLVERYFGKLDAEAIYTYAYVWPLDKFNVTHTAFDVESVAAVCTRIRQTILDLEDQYHHAHIVLVSHADTLQISKLYAARAENVGLFSSYRFKNGEVRRMILGSREHFPEPQPLEAPKRDTQEIMKELQVDLTVTPEGSGD